MADLLIGAGFLAGFIANLSVSSKIICVKRSKNQRILNSKKQLIFADIATESGLQSLRSLMEGFEGNVFFMIPPSIFVNKSIVGSLTALFDVLAIGKIQAVVIASSTGIYSTCSEDIIDNSTRPAISNKRVERLNLIEQTWLKSPFNVSIARLGGLYSLERVVGLSLLKSKKILTGTGHEHLNLIHAFDAARALLELTKTHHHGKTYVLTDLFPVARKEYYDFVARWMITKPPVFDGDFKNSYSCDSSSTWFSLGLRPKFANYKTGLSKNKKAG